MTDYSRYAIFYVPPERSELAIFGAAWLGWDSIAGRTVDHPVCPGIDVAALTATPRKYGFHGTLKPPFRLADSTKTGALVEALSALTKGIVPFQIPSLAVRSLGRFVALVPSAPSPKLSDLAARLVTELDAFRAPASDTELARRRAAGLTQRQEANLATWGYPYVLEDFRFHLTLSGALESEKIPAVTSALMPLTAGLTQSPLAVDAVTLCGEQPDDGRFRVVRRFDLSG